MRILQMISSAGYYGAEAVVANLTAALRRSGCDASVAVFQNRHCPPHDTEQRLRDMGIPVVLAPCAGRADLRTTAWIVRYLRDAEIDILHTHGYKANLYGYAATRFTRTPIVATCHNWIGNDFALRSYESLDRALLKRFQAVIAVSDPVRGALQRCGVEERRIRVIGNGVDIGRFSAAGRSGPFAAPGRRVVAFVGRLAVEKGILDFVRGAAKILAASPPAVILVAGEGPARAEAERLSVELGISASVRFLGKWDAVEQVYAAADVVALPSQNEGAPMTVLEAMAAGCAVVATRVGALPQIVVEGETGLLVDPEHAEAFADAVIGVLRDPVTLERLASAGRRRARELFSSDAMAKEYVSVYQEAAKPHRRAGRGTGSAHIHHAGRI